MQCWRSCGRLSVVYHEATQAWLISRYDDVERAFKDKAFTSKNYEWQLEPVHGRTILQMEGRDHSRPPEPDCSRIPGQ